MDDTVAQFPRTFKRSDEQKTFMRPYEVGKQTCRHRRFIIDESLDQIECADCHERLNPMWVLKHLANEEHLMNQDRQHYREEMKRLEARSKTTCEHCGKMTRISRSKANTKDR